MSLCTMFQIAPQWHMAKPHPTLASFLPLDLREGPGDKAAPYLRTCMKPALSTNLICDDMYRQLQAWYRSMIKVCYAMTQLGRAKVNLTLIAPTRKLCA